MATSDGFVIGSPAATAEDETVNAEEHEAIMSNVTTSRSNLAVPRIVKIYDQKADYARTNAVRAPAPRRMKPSVSNEGAWARVSGVTSSLDWANRASAAGSVSSSRAYQKKHDARMKQKTTAAMRPLLLFGGSSSSCKAANFANR